MKLCNCNDLHQQYKDLLIIDGRHRCEKCGQPWSEMPEPKPDLFGRFMRGECVIHFRDGYVSLVDVGEPLKAKYVYPRPLR